MRLAIVGATGEVGRTALTILGEQAWDLKELHLLASARSSGTQIGRHVVQDLARFDPSRADVAVFSAGSGVSADYAPRFAEAGCFVVDNSSQFRYDDDKELVVPEVNGARLSSLKTASIVANPNCSTIQIVMAVKPLHDLGGLSRVSVATYQAVSGAGRKGIDQLEREVRGHTEESSPFAKPIQANVIPQIDQFQENGYTKEEMKVVWETRKILGLPKLPVHCTAVRVPVVNGHSAAVQVELEREVSMKEAEQALRAMPGLRLVDGPDFPTPREVDSSNETFVGRLRKDLSHPRGLAFWVVADNLRKGAAWNALQIARRLIT